MIGCWKNRLKWRFYPVKFHVKLINLQKPILVQCVVNEGSRLEVVETGDKDCLFPEDRCGTFHITLCAYGQYCTPLKKCRTSLCLKRWRSPPKNRRGILAK